MPLVRRILWAAIVVWLTATAAFIALRLLPGDAIAAQLMDSGADAAAIQARRDALGLNDPWTVQYIRFLAGLLRGDLGESLNSGQSVSELIAFNLGPTITLAGAALAVAIGLGLGLGLAAALPGWRIVGGAARFAISLGLSTPIYWTGTLAIYVFTVQLALLPSGGAGRLSQLILPAAVLGFHTATGVARVVQHSVQSAAGADFVRVARAKGLPERHVWLRHVLRAGLLPVTTVIALQAGFLLSGVVITEALFVRPGLGRLLLDATLRQDYPVVQGVVMLTAVMYVAVNTVADLLNRLLDPRVRV
ncbi:MAG: ABC transporter permease [Chloroflexota bacterium]|nr:MAG: hypothetical protein DIU68_19520 [Chloroflexota bacterium]